MEDKKLTGKIRTFGALASSRKIRVPEIQRDYVQGRRNHDVDDIRKGFVDTLLDVIEGIRPHTELDFIYGSEQNGNFEPLDGQQRLTTLCLLNWFLGANSIKAADGTSSLSYATRVTTQEFCDELVSHTALDMIKEARQNRDRNKKTIEDYQKNVKEAKDKGDNLPESPELLTDSLCALITSRHWFKWGWNYDPSIKSMLVMLDELETGIFDRLEHEERVSSVQQDAYNDDKEKEDKRKKFEETLPEKLITTFEKRLVNLRDRLDKITFDFKDLESLRMSRELYIKMNARGKQLSDFDKMKSTLEEEIQQQAADGDVKEIRKIEEEWRRLMDSDWIDLFWVKFAKDNTTKDSVSKAEKGLMKLILRMIALQLFGKLDEGNLRTKVYDLDENNLKNILTEYQKSLANERRVKTTPRTISSPRIDFRELITDLNNLVKKDANGLIDGDVTSLLCSDVTYDKGYNYFDKFTVNSDIQKDLMAIWWAMVLYLREHPYATAPNKGVWQSEFSRFMRFVRNVLNNDNNNDRLDKEWKLAKTFKALQDIIPSNFGQDIISVDVAINKITPYAIQGLDNNSLKEEIDKAKLRLDPKDGVQWQEILDIAESDNYLWGQIRCILSWSEHDLKKFQTYMEYVKQITTTGTSNNTDEISLLYAAIIAGDGLAWGNILTTPQSDLTEREYPVQMYQWISHRDYSVKRCLRDQKTGNYGWLYRDFIDTWKNTYSELSIKKYCQKLIKDRLDKNEKNWRWVLCKHPEYIRDYNGYHAIAEIANDDIAKNIHKGHVVILEKRTPTAMTHDPVLLYM